MALEVRIQGLTEFRRSLKALDREHPKALRMSLNAAADVVVSDAKPRVPHRGGAAQGSVRAKSTQRLARVSGGGSRAPYYPWLDFGGSVGRKRSVHRPFLPRGRYIYNAFFRRRGEFVDALDDSLRDVIRRVGLDVTGS